MAELLIINPSLRPSKRKHKGAKTMAKRRTAAQKAATRKLVALNRSKRMANPRKRRAKARRRTNPIAKRHVYRAVKRRRNPLGGLFKKRRHHARRRRNPIGGFSLNGVMDLAKEGAIGASGALIVDLFMGNVPMLPASVMSRRNADGSVNYLYYATKGAVAVGLGAMSGVVGSWSKTAALGAMTVNLYDLFRSIMPAGIPLGYINTAMPAGPRLGQYNSRRMATQAAPAAQQPALSGNVNARGFQSGIGMYTGEKAGLSMYTRG